jgi:hypothetical protein
MPLRFPKTLYQNWQAGMEQIVTLDGRSFVFETRQGVHFFNPARYSEIRKITFWMLVTMNTTDFSGTATAFRHRLAAVSDGLSDKVLRQTTLAAGGQVQTPDGSNFALGFGNATSTINANNLYGNNGNASFQSLQPAPTAGNQSFGLFQQTFDRFTAGDQELFDRLLGVQDPDQWVAFIPALEGNGTITTGQSQIQIRSIGYTVTQAPSPNNKTVTYIPISWGRDNSSTGPTDFNENDAQSQIGGNSFRYVEDDWDGITGMKLLVNFANRLNTSGITVRANKVNSLSAKTTDQLLTDTIAGTLANSYGVFRSDDFFDQVSDGDLICFDYNHIGNPGTGNGQSAVCSAFLEIVQENCSRTTTTFSAFIPHPFEYNPSTTWTNNRGFWNGTLFDPQFFLDYPDSLFFRKYAYGGALEDTDDLDYNQAMLLSSVLGLNNVQFTSPNGGETVFTSLIDRIVELGTDQEDGWVYQEKPIGLGTARTDPISLAGQRVLFWHMRSSNQKAAINRHASTHLAYNFFVPETDTLDLGPLFQLDAYTPDGCASTSAGSGENPGILAIANGSGRTRKFNPDDGTISFLGIDRPFRGEVPTALAADAAASPEGALEIGTYYYRYTLKNSSTGHESNASFENIEVDTSAQSPRASVTLSFANVRIPGDPQIDTICIYRGLEGVEESVLFRKVGEFNIDETSSFVDTVGDDRFDDLEDPLAAIPQLNAPPPCTPVIAEFRGRLFAFGDIPQLSPAGRVAVTKGSKEIIGNDEVEWDNCLLGRFIQIEGDPRKYEIEEILPPEAGLSPPIQRIRVTEEYLGETDNNLKYIICGRPNRLYVSEPDDPESWPESSFLDIEIGDGDRLQGGISNYDALVICKRNKSYVLRFTNNPVLEVNQPSRVSSDIGAIAPRSFAQVEVGSVWLADRGLAMFDGRGVQHLPESDLCNDLFVDPNHPMYVPRDRNGRVPGAIGVFYPRREQYLLLLPTVKSVRGGANLMLVWDTSLRNITFYEFCQEFTAMEVAKDAEGNQRVYLGDANGFVWIFDVGDTDGVGFPNATGTVRGTIDSAGVEDGASFLEDLSASFISGGVPGLADLSGVSGLSGFSGDNNMGLAGACVFTRAADAAPDDPWVQRFIYASTRTRLWVTPSWGTETPSAGFDYMIGAIEFVAEFKPSNMMVDDLVKRGWRQIVTFDPVTKPSKLRVELLRNFAVSDEGEEDVLNEIDNEIVAGAGRLFDLSQPGGRIDRPTGRMIYDYMQVRMKNFAPDEPVQIFNHILRPTPKQQQA